ncbi:MAG: hypothetical protein KDB16_04230, partial [Acidimicrobiales bacterium]|nr:hypothetical protein [Acidimicrobiales bacterium]
EPDFVARAWLDQLYVAEHAYSGRVVDGAKTLVPMDLLTGSDADSARLTLAKDGEGRLYYRIGLRYAPADFVLEPLDRGFVVTRTYEAIDDPDDVWRDDSGVWHVRAGADVRVKLTMTAESRRTQVALVDPMPAGFEALNPSLATTGVVDDGTGELASARSWWWWNWFEHQNLRDDRAEAITSYLPAGTYDYSYVVRATTPGTFVVPPARAEQIYEPETFGRSASLTVTVED